MPGYRGDVPREPMFGDREILAARIPWDDGEIDPESQIILAYGRPVSAIGRTRSGVDRAVEVLLGDVDDPRSAFERTQDQYNGTDRRGTPTFDLLDDDVSKLM